MAHTAIMTAGIVADTLADLLGEQLSCRLLEGREWRGNKHTGHLCSSSEFVSVVIHVSVYLRQKDDCLHTCSEAADPVDSAMHAGFDQHP